MTGRLIAWRGDRSWPRAVVDWARCWTVYLVPIVWGLGIQFDWFTVDRSRVPTLILWGVAGVVHRHRALEKEGEQDRELQMLMAERATARRGGAAGG